MELQLDKPDRYDSSETSLDTGDIVQLHSKALQLDFSVKVVHSDESEYGGNVVSDSNNPLLNQGDHVHFKLEHVQ